MSAHILPRKSYESLAQAAGAENISKSLLQTAKAMGAPGFVAHRLNWTVFEPWLTEHRAELEEQSECSTEEIKKRLMLQDETLKHLEIAKRKGEQLDPVEVKEFMAGFGTTLAATLKKKQKILRSKCVGYEHVIDTEFVDIFSAVNKELEKWIRK